MKIRFKLRSLFDNKMREIYAATTYHMLFWNETKENKTVAVFITSQLQK